MSDLHRRVACGRQNFGEKYSGLSRAIGTLTCDRRAHVNDDCHPVLISGTKDALQAADVLRIFEVDIGVAEVQLEAGFEVRIVSAASDFLDGVVFQWVDAAEAAQAAGVKSDL